jgi:hypothetical protein
MCTILLKVFQWYQKYDNGPHGSRGLSCGHKQINKTQKNTYFNIQITFYSWVTSNYVGFHVPLTISHKSWTFVHGHHELIGRFDASITFSNVIQLV